MTIFDWIFQIALNKLNKGQIYNAEFVFKHNSSGEQHTASRSFRALSPEQAERIKVKFERYHLRLLHSPGFLKQFGIKHDDNGFLLNNIQRVSGTRNLKNNFRKGLMPGDIPMFAFTRYSYSLIFEGIKKATTPDTLDKGAQTQNISKEEVELVKFRLLGTFGAGTAVFITCLGGVIYILSKSQFFSLSSYAFISFSVISLLVCIASFIQYKGLPNGQ